MRGDGRRKAMKEGVQRPDAQLEEEIAALLEAGNTDRAWVLTTYLNSAMLRRKWYARVKAAIGKKQ